METVTIKLAGRALFRVSEYELRCGIFEQPGTFRCSIGTPYSFRTLAEAFPPRTPYQVFMGNALMQTGLTDGFQLAGGDGTEIQLNGRGLLGWLTQQTIDKELSFASPTYYKLVEEAVERSGLQVLMDRFGLKGNRIQATNEANRKAFTGSQRAKSITSKTTEVIQTEVGENEGAGTKRVYEHIRAEVGTSWWQFLVEQLRRGGLFLWEGVDGRLILSTPSAEQLPVFRLVRTAEENNILGETFSHSTSNRHSECLVYGRGKKGKDGTTKFDGRYVDKEMVALLNPDPKDQVDGGTLKIVQSIRDSQVRSAAHANTLARRTIAEERRQAWRLSYTIQGHYIPELLGVSPIRPAPESVCEVHDDYLGLYGQLMVESVIFSGRDASTTATLNMVRPEDVFFREDEPERPKPKLSRKGPNTLPNTKVQINAIATFESRFQEAPGLGEFGYPADGLDYIDELGKQQGEQAQASNESALNDPARDG